MTDKKRILIVDDEPNFLELLKLRLEANGYDTSEAMTGREGLEKVRGEKIDLILLDIVMPDMDGYTFLHKIKADLETRSIPIIVVTGKPDMKEIFLIEGVQAIIDKPIGDNVLLKEVRKALGEESPA
jgi:adenylate cyclase